jgi:phosphatidylserine/phosphatidylglycerophosphate/cardiolipin synthase-like enzyme
MAKFLDTTGISYHLQQLINNSEEKLILISPYLKINDRIKQCLEEKDKFKIDIRLIYGKSELQPTEHNWLKSLRSIRTSFCKDLHAKCYLNENEAIITSMNLYDFSQVNNYEMGIYIQKDKDGELYSDTYKEVARLIRVSDEIKVTVLSVPNISEKPAKSVSTTTGYCIRCHSEIKLNPMVPYCKACYSTWKKYEDNEYEEKFCHVCGKSNKSTLIRPSCYECYKSNKGVLEFPLV